jgi:tryptophanyl-tRNA synthetase
MTENRADAIRDNLGQARERGAALEARVRQSAGSFRVLTGDRPTGPLHLGHYFGTLQNRVRLQDLGVETVLIIADYQVLTDRDVAENLPGHVEHLVLDYLATGIDPERTTVFTHSSVPGLNQLLFYARTPTCSSMRSPSRSAA